MFKKFLLCFLLLTSNIFSQKINIELRKCSLRNGCICNCEWTKQVDCLKIRDDGSCCFSCCCKTSKNTQPTQPTQPKLEYYCPNKDDFIQAYGNPILLNRGWINKGSGGVATKSSFNILGGFIEYDIDVSKVEPGVNANIYSISPIFPSSGFTQKFYCDGQKKDSEWCTEIDWIESNGNCLGASTLHMIQGPGSGCTAWGCNVHYEYNGKTKFHMKIQYSKEGKITIYRDEQVITEFKPKPTEKEVQNLLEQYSNRGAVIYSSLWKGWVPLQQKCKTDGNLENSEFKIENLKIYGKLIQGPKLNGNC